MPVPAPGRPREPGDREGAGGGEVSRRFRQAILLRARPTRHRAISIDVGDQDGLRNDAGKLHEVLDGYGIANDFEVYQGTHTSKVAERFQNHVIPFFSRNLCFEPGCR